MGIGGSIFLIALGAILTFATNITLSGLDLNVVGIILMIVGALGLVLFLLVWGPHSRRVRTTTTDGVVEERRVYNERPDY